MRLNCDSDFVRYLFEGQYDPSQILINKLKETEDHIYLFGAGSVGCGVEVVLRQQDIHICAFCDNDKAKQGKTIDGVPVISFEEMCNDVHKIVLLTTFYGVEAVMEQCELAGIPYINASTFSVYTDAGDKEFITCNIPEISSAFDLCADRQSKQVFTAALCARLNHGAFAMKPFRSNNKQYIEPELFSYAGTIVFDCGAYTGDSVRDFIQEGANKVYCFEPDPNSFRILQKNTEGSIKIKCVQAGVGIKAQKLPFASGRSGFSSFYCPSTGASTAEIISIDEYVPVCRELPDVIKMDIEGFELEALHGAEKTIQMYKPTLAICVYHKSSDFVKIPEYVLSLRPDYKVYFRHYTNIFYETVAYFI